MTQQFATVEIRDVVAEFIKSMIKLSDDPRQVMAGIYNAFVHGEIFEEIGFDITEEQLVKVFDGIEIMSVAIEDADTYYKISKDPYNIS